MNYIYGALLLHSAKKPIDEEHLKKVLESSGEPVDESRVKALVAALEGVNIDDVISKAAAPVVTSAPAVAVETKAAPEEDEKAKEKKAEEAAEGLGALFG